MKVFINTIPHADMRIAGQVGDWVIRDDGNLYIDVSDLGDWRKEMCIAFHEMHEALECIQKGIDPVEVDDFDYRWKPHNDILEAGDDPDAPYHRMHVHATVAEKHLAKCLGLDWLEYNKAVDALYVEPSR